MAHPAAPCSCSNFWQRRHTFTQQHSSQSSKQQFNISTDLAKVKHVCEKTKSSQDFRFVFAKPYAFFVVVHTFKRGTKSFVVESLSTAKKQSQTSVKCPTEQNYVIIRTENTLKNKTKRRKRQSAKEQEKAGIRRGKSNRERCWCQAKKRRRRK